MFFHFAAASSIGEQIENMKFKLQQLPWWECEDNTSARQFVESIRELFHNFIGREQKSFTVLNFIKSSGIAEQIEIHWILFLENVTCNELNPPQNPSC